MRSLVSLAVWACMLGAQEPSQAPDSTTPQTLLDVVARDKKGRPVSDLKASDLQILDEGAPAKIMGLRLVTAGDAAGLGPASEPLRHVRLVSLVFDKLDAEERRFARQAALDFLNDDFGPNVYMGVFVADPRLLLIQPYTSNRDLVRQAVEQAATAEYTELAAQSATNRKKLEDSLQKTTAATPVNVAAVLAQITVNALHSEEQLVRIKQWRSSVLALLSLVEEQARLPGRKTLLYFSDDLQVPESMTEAFNNTIAAANHAHVSVYGVPTRGWTTEEHGKKGLLKLHKGSPPAAPTPPPVALEQLSNNTGGLLMAKTNDARAAFRKVGEDIGAYYEIAYVPSHSGYDGRFRKVAVQVDVPDVKMQARSGYLALPPSLDTAFVYELPLLRALNANPAPSDFPFQCGALRFRPDGGKLEYGVVVDAPFRDVTFVEDKTTHSFRAHLSLLALLKDEHGLIVGRFSRDVPLEVPGDKIEAFRQGSFNQTFRLGLAPGPYTLEAAAMDHESQKLGARKVALVAPAARPDLNISDLAMVRRIEPETGPADIRDPFNFEGGRVVPALDNTIAASSSGELSYYVVVYPAASVADKPQLTLEFVKDGNSVGQASPELPPGKDGRIPYVASLPLANFAPGTYELHLTVNQGAAVAEQKATFTIKP
ncbi:MAG: VWA domain-containing protein [Acidobacteriia bacterium]|nr:VWA domain-containing protein [Terriglobia bacterium]